MITTQRMSLNSLLLSTLSTVLLQHSSTIRMRRRKRDNAAPLTVRIKSVVMLMLFWLIHTTHAFVTSCGMTPMHRNHGCKLTTKRRVVDSSRATTTARPRMAVSEYQGPSFNRQRNPNIRSYLATCIPGLANVLADELNALGAWSVETSGTAAVTFEGDLQMGLQALLWVRTAHRLLEFVADGYSLTSRDDLYDAIRSSVSVKDLLGNGSGGLLTLSVKVVLQGNALDIPKDIAHSHYTALTVKNALCDEVRDLRGDRPDVDVENAQVPLVCMLRGNNSGASAVFTLWRSLHPPGSLHKRGYRGGGVIHKAAMKESLAAGLLLMAGWKDAISSPQEEIVLVDPMCGSGSLVLEAAMMAADIAPGLMRIKCGLNAQPPVLQWKQEENAPKLWKDLVWDATQRAKAGLQQLRESGRITLHANDVHDGALDILQQSLSVSGLSNVIQVHQYDCRDFIRFENEKRRVGVFTNPPWGVRLSEQDHESWEDLRIFLRQRCPPNTQAWVLSGNKSATKHLGLKRSQSMVVRTANQDLRWIQYIIRDRQAKEDTRQHEQTVPKRKKKTAQRVQQRTTVPTKEKQEEEEDTWY